ncbi:helix-hairpin-helix domain-containing protein [Lacticaseibacillus pabuli]|uniref:Helix-hairpin-helix domain-containing protein n=2 Tax=Lacticaseibacillus pabuli TaxID=3025672 RepID=A0ABY7WNC4_9LACO|nr:helix-hairpin-helix domain-containing protein [Lacticaseibacillus sp. KACC 23028]WDF81631.1 helix-hairpin-helix domain-containing protein [Lacticaseibacillus sp. KACC 23028]
MMTRLMELLKDYWRYVLIGTGAVVLLGGWYGYHTVQVRSEQNRLALQASQAKQTPPKKTASSAATSSGKGGYVYIAGAVKHPGLYHIDGQTRWADVVQAAGGLTKDADGGAVNLAKVARDEENLAIPTRGASNASQTVAAGTATAGSAGVTAASGSATAGAGAQVNLNSATVDQLQTISGVGPKRAQDILAYRDEHGGFKKVADLKEVSGIGDKMFANIEPHVTVGP